MCIGLEKRHVQCGHLRSFTIKVACVYATETGIKCSKQQCPLVEGEIVSPPLCVICYRKTEKVICDEADEQRDQIKMRIESVQQELQDPDLTPYERYMAQIQLNDEMVLQTANRRERGLMLSDFRKSQGVWGDG
ncbi:hypothetical protein MMC29_002825 [Sticta canariensis]|nr:hypothetical protein [Sticta canariensis]